MQDESTAHAHAVNGEEQQRTAVYDDGHLRVEHDNFYVSCNGNSIKLPRTEFLIISRLVKNPERFVRAEDLWREAWGERKAFNPVSLHVYIYRLRTKFAPCGIQIETLVGVGYRLSNQSGIQDTDSAEIRPRVT
jgi:DNA-binding response OmpR family regulator